MSDLAGQPLNKNFFHFTSQHGRETGSGKQPPPPSCTGGHVQLSPKRLCGDEEEGGGKEEGHRGRTRRVDRSVLVHRREAAIILPT